MRGLSYISTILLLFLFLNAQSQAILQWETTMGGSFNDKANAIASCRDGGVIVVGKTESKDGDIKKNIGKYDFWIVKLNEDGNMVWQKNYGDEDFDSANEVIENKEGDYIIAGWSNSIHPKHKGMIDGHDTWILKLNSKGEQIWLKEFKKKASTHKLIEIQNKQYLLIGYSEDDNGNWIYRLDANGEFIEEINLGKNKIDVGRCFEQTDNGYIVAGVLSSQKNLKIDKNDNLDLGILKLNKNFQVEWERNLGGSKNDYVSSVLVDPNGDFVFAGSSFSSDGDVDNNNNRKGWNFWILKIDKNGKLLWETILGGNAGEEATGIENSAEGGYIISGWTQSSDGDIDSNNGGTDAWIVKLDNNGEMLWEQTFGGSEEDLPLSVVATGKGAYAVAGFSRSQSGDVKKNQGRSDFWVFKIKENLQQITAFAYEDINRNGNFDQNEPYIEDLIPEINPQAISMEQNKIGKTIYQVLAGSYQLNIPASDHWESKNENPVSVQVKKGEQIEVAFACNLRTQKTEEPIKETPKEETSIPKNPGKKKSLKELSDIECGVTLELSELYFKPNTNNFIEQDVAYDYMEILLTYMKHYPTHRIELYGHTDFLSNNKESMKVLSQKRVDRVKNFLVENGILANRISTKAYGDTKPIITHRLKKDRSQNRRVEVFVNCL